MEPGIREFEKLGASFNEMAATRERASRAKDEFLGLVSHELKTPITTVLGNAAILRDRSDKLDADQRQTALDDIYDGAQRLAAIIDNMLALARLERGAELDSEPLQLLRMSSAVAQALTETYLEAEVDDPVNPINIPRPRYPPVMQQAGITGSVDVQYVVDTTGHAEPVSWKILRSTNKAFEEPAREAIMKGVFKPARIRGKAVRQLVQQKISFNISQ